MVHQEGDEDTFRVKAAVSREEREAKRRHSEALQHQISANDSTSVWKGLRRVNYRPNAPPLQQQCTPGQQRQRDSSNTTPSSPSPAGAQASSHLDCLHHHPHHQKAEDQGTEGLQTVPPTSGVMKSFEPCASTPQPSPRPPPGPPAVHLQGQQVCDTVHMALPYILQHLDSAGSYARILFVELHIQHHLTAPLQVKLSVPDPTCRWIRLPV